MPQLTFWANGNRILNEAGSGLGFFGNGFGTPILVSAWNQRTYICSSDGTSQGAEAPNLMWASTTGVVLGQSGSGLALTQVPNAQASFEARFEHDTPVRVPTATMYVYDRASINNNPSGATWKLFELIHPSPIQNNSGSGDTTWTTPGGSSVTLSLAPSPGSGGQYAGNSNSTREDRSHSWFLGMSVSPTTVGSKNGAAYLAVEYL